VPTAQPRRSVSWATQAETWVASERPTSVTGKNKEKKSENPTSVTEMWKLACRRRR
jgi:hypothetical protein